MRNVSTAAFFALALLAADPGFAQTEPPKPSLRGRLGVEAARPLLRAEPTELRQRAFERLGSTPSTAALGLLAHALEPGGEARNARERLVVVRALAGYANEEVARGALLRAMAGGEALDEPKDALVRETAALALARSRDPRSVELLSQALRQAGRTGETARIALVAHPPRKIQVLLSARGAPTESLVELLGELGDPEGAPLLETASRSALPALRAKALGALLRLDPRRAASVARELGGDRDARVRTESVRVLALTRAAEAGEKLAALASDPATASAALAIAIEARNPDLGPALARVHVAIDDRDAWLAALARSGGPEPLARLETALATADTRWAAAYALALSTDDAAEDILVRALGSPDRRGDAARALTLRAAAEISHVDLDDALVALARSPKTSDRAAWAFALGVTAPQRGAELVNGADPVVVRAVARTATHPTVARACAERLVRESDPGLRGSLAIALALPEAADLVPNRVLVELVESRGAAAHLAANALAARDGEGLRPRLREFLESGDPVLRTHTALGLARSREASAVGLLADAYRFEVEPRVRRAIVTALGARSEPGRRRTLDLAKELDPDPEVRRLARAALGTEPATNTAATAASEPRGTAWFKLPPPAPGPSDTMFVVETSAGLALPLAPDPDGSVLLARLPEGGVRKRIAAARPGLEAPGAVKAAAKAR